MATPNSRSEEETAKGVFEAIGASMVPAVIHRLKAHRDASREGVTPQELEPDGKAAAEIDALWQWVCAELQIGTRAQVRNSTSARVQKRSA
jgi:chromosome partitioning protein